MVVQIEILEERLSVKSVLADNLNKAVDNIGNNLALLSSWHSSVVVGGNTGVGQANIDGLFELLLGEDFVNVVREGLPADVLTFLWRLEVLS